MIEKREVNADDEFLSRYPLIKPAADSVVKPDEPLKKEMKSDSHLYTSRKYSSSSMMPYSRRMHPYSTLPPKLSPSPAVHMLQQGQYYLVSSPKSASTTNQEDSNVEPQFPSYTAMIAQAILSTKDKKITLGGIYEFIEYRFKGLEKRVKGWRNCVRHNLSLNECFIKLGRSDCGRGNDWAIHPNYLESFLRGEYRKRRACMKQRQDFSWLTHEYLQLTRQFSLPSKYWQYYPCLSTYSSGRMDHAPPSPTISNGSISPKRPGSIESTSSGLPSPLIPSPTGGCSCHHPVF